MKLPANSRASRLAPLPALASAVALFAGPSARCAEELCAYWPLDENSGTVVPNNSATAAATLYNGATWVAGTINNALSFNGVNQYVTGVVTVPLTNTAVSMWFRTTQSGGGLYAAINSNGSGHDRHIYLNGGNIYSRIWNEETISSTGKNFADGQWHQVVHTFGGVAGGQKIYVDGNLVASGNKSASDFNSQTHIQLGHSSSSPTRFFNGQLDDVRIWNHALTAAEAQALAQRSGTANYPNPPSVGIIGGAPLKLDWLAPTGATSHDIYLSGSPDIANSTPASEDFMGNFTTKPLNVMDASPGSYYWRVDERLDTTVFKGPVWSFQYLGGTGSNSINFSQPTAWWVGANESFLQSGVLSGSGIFYKDGPGTLLLTGNNIHSGGTIIRDGVLQVGDGGTSGSLGSGPVTTNSTLAFNRSDNFIFSGTLNGPGSVVQYGPGGLTLSGTGVTYTGTSVLNGGSLTIAGTPNFNSTIQINNGNLIFNTTSNYIVAPKVISGAGPVTINGNNGNWTILTADNTYTGGTLINSGGMLLLGNNTPAGSVLGDITDNGTLGLYHSNAWTFSNNVSGAGVLNLYSPSGNAVTVNGNTISLGNLNAFQNPGGILTNTTVNLSGSLNLSTNSTLTVGSGANVTVAGGMTQGGNAYNGTMSTLKVTGGNLTFGQQINDGWDGAYTVTQTGGTVRAPGVTGGNGGGAWSRNTYNLQGGTLILGANGINGPYYKAPWHGNGGGLTMYLNFGGATLSASANWTSGWGVNLTGTNGDLTVDPTGYSITINRPVTGIGGINLIGTGTLTLAGANTYSGSTTIGTGTTFGGAGGMTGPVFNNGTLTPGNNGAGILAVNNTLTLAPDSAIVWQMTNCVGVPGTGYGQIAVNSLDLTATVENPVTIKIIAPALTTVPAAEYAFVLIQSATPITGFDTDKFTLDTTSLPAGQGTWSIRQVGNTVELVYHNGSQVQGCLLVEKWLNVSGYSVSDLIASSRIYGKPDSVVRDNLESLMDFPGEYFGTRTRGYITPQTTGNYTFWLSARTSAELWLSKDGTGNKYAKERIAVLDSTIGTGHGIPIGSASYWDVFSSQRSVQIHLEAGHSYYLEIVHQHGHAGGAHASVAWAMNDGNRVGIPAAVCSSYVKTSDDQDDDYLPDAWETQYGLDISDNGATDPVKQGERGDFDGDGLNNREEYLLGTNPATADTDGDGMSDTDEVRRFGTSPTTSNTILSDLVDTPSLTDYNPGGTSGTWQQFDGGLLGSSFRGQIEWSFNVPSDGWWVIDLGGRLRGTLRQTEELNLGVKIDGMPLAEQKVRFLNGQSSNLKIVTPYLHAGTHTFNLDIRNEIGRRIFQIQSLQVFATGGVDLDENGRPDWLDTILAQGNVLAPVPAESPVSPLFLEGSIRHLNGATVAASGSSVAVQRGLGDLHWFANAPLNSTGSTPVKVAMENGEQTVNVIWSRWNAMAGQGLTIRAGDAVKIGGWVTAEDIGNVSITVAGQTENIDASGSFVKVFSQAGSYPVTVSHYGGNQTTATITVVTADFGTPMMFYADLLTWRSFPQVPAILKITAEPSLGIDTTQAEGTGQKALLRPFRGGSHTLAARLPNGPIVALGSVITSSISDSLRSNAAEHIGTTADGYSIIRTPLVVTDLPPGGYVVLTIFRAGVTFLDGTTVKTLTAEDFVNGVAYVEFRYPPGMTGGFCHYIDVYDAQGRNLGRR